MENDNKAKSQAFKGYSVAFIEDLLGIVGRDVQNNTPVFDEDYMTVALSACKQFNEDLADEKFDIWYREFLWEPRNP